MNVIQTFVAAPLYNKESKSYQNLDFGMGGFASRHSYYCMWANSYLSLKKLFPKIYLYCDALGGELLTEKLGLDYDEVITISVPGFAQKSSGIWVYSKLQTYACQAKPFLHFDGDFVLNTVLSEEMLNSDVIFEFPHTRIDRGFLKVIDAMLWVIKGDSYFYSKLNFLFDAFEHYRNGKPLMYNFGLFGGNANEKLSQFSNMAMELAEHVAEKGGINDFLLANMFLEQFLLTQMTYAENLTIGSIQPKQFDRENLLLDFFEKGYAISHLHALSHYKVLFKPYIESQIYLENHGLFTRISDLVRRGEI